MPKKKSQRMKQQRHSEKRRRRRLRRQKRKQRAFPDLPLEEDILGTKLLMEPPGEVKMSEVLEAFVEPFLEFAETTEAMRRLFAVAMLAWNVSFFSEEERQEMIEEFIETAISSPTPEEREDIQEIVAVLLKRKKELFPEYNRKIISFELVDTGEEYRLLVASTLDQVRTM